MPLGWLYLRHFMYEGDREYSALFWNSILLHGGLKSVRQLWLSARLSVVWKKGTLPLNIFGMGYFLAGNHDDYKIEYLHMKRPDKALVETILLKIA